jgi:hypothetical protein
VNQQTGKEPEPIPPGSPGYGGNGTPNDPAVANGAADDVGPTDPQVVGGITDADFPGVNSWFLAGINPDGTGLAMAGSMFSFPQLPLPAPFTEAGPDPTPESTDPRDPNSPVGCDSYQVQPALSSSDTIRVGEVQATAGQRIQIPVYLISSAPAAAIQLVLSYDSSLITIDPDERRLDWSGTTFEPLLGKTFDKYNVNGEVIGSITYSAPNCSITNDPETGIFAIGIVSIFSVEGFEIPSSNDVQFINVLERREQRLERRAVDRGERSAPRRRAARSSRTRRSLAWAARGIAEGRGHGRPG